jgi:methyl-accepting chemotaxis protein
VLSTGKPYISQPFVPEDERTNKYSIFLAAPIRDKGQIVGIVRARMPVRYMSDVLASQQKQNPGQGDLTLYLIDQQGVVFASSTETVGSQGQTLNAETLVPNFDTIQAKEEIQTQTLGRESLTSYVPLKQVGQAFQGELPDLGWSTLSTIAQENAFVPLVNLRTTLIVGTLAIMFFIALVVVGTVSRLLEPLVAATRTVNRIGEGDLKARLLVQGNDEMAQLGRNINNMAEQIERLLQEQAVAAQEAQFLAEIANYSVTTAQDLAPLFNQALGRVRQMLDVDRIALYHIAPGEPTLLAEATQAQTLANTAFALPALQADRVARYHQGTPWIVPNLLTAEVESDYYRWLNQIQVKAMVDMPLIGGDDRLLVLMVHDCRSPRAWPPQQVEFLRELANRLATAISRVNFLEQIAIARQQAETLAAEQTALKEGLQQRALELLMEVDPVSQGDLTIRARVTEDEIGTVADSYNATIESLSTIVAQVQRAAAQVAITARSSESAVGNLSTGAINQTAELAAALQRIEEMARSIEEVTTNAQAAEVAVQQASQTVQEGDQAMNRTVEGILAIRETVGETAKKVKRLGESSQRISKVVNLIGTFAAQTNLLALNASIEAARAGEEGRGFAVVADEVRSLARQSAEATAEIETLVAGIQAETQEVVAAMEAGTAQVVMGTQLVDATRQSLNRIAATSQEISRLVGAIATAAGQQSSTSESVTQSMTGLATIAQQTSTEAEQLAASFQQLLTVAQTLQGEVARFKIS